MSKDKTQVAGYRFDDIYLDVRNRQLWRKGQLLPLTSKYFDVLLLLVRQSGHLVEKQRIFDEVWDGVIVTDAALTQCIKDIRKLLGDDAANPRYIKTVPKHGYIFIGKPVEALAKQAVATSQPSLPPGSDIKEISRRPYKFLDYYTEQDAPLFFGREGEVETICSQILAHRSFILHGRSGVGKSSIVRAGLMPRLKSQGHLVFVIRSFTDPVPQMRHVLLQVPEVNIASQLEELVIGLMRTAPNRSVIFFLDQFEDFFLLLAETSRQQFIATIGKLFADETLPLRLVFALREDLLAEMSQLKPAIPEIFHHEYRLKRLSREQAARAITEPAKAVGCYYEAGLVERLLDDLGDQDVVDPPQLQIVCDQLYDARERSGGLTVAVYERLGTASQILASYLEHVLRRFHAADLRLAKEILKALISAEGPRLVLRAAELEARVGRQVINGSAAIKAILEELAAARVVRWRSQDGESWLELAHDFLIPEISRWLTADDWALKRARGVLERAMENYRAHQLMIDADALDLLLPFGEQLGLNGEEADLLIRSLLNRARPAPDWLVRAAPSSPGIIAEAFRHDDPNVRLCAIAASRLVRDPEMKNLLRRVALWDRRLLVRKAACIALADWFGTAAEKIFSEAPDEDKVGLLRRVVSLALIRDYDRQFILFSHLPITVSLTIILALVWVRLRRHWHQIARLSLGGTLGGAVSGILGGLMLGSGLAMARHATALEATSLILVLINLGALVGAAGALGVSFGMVAATHVTYRHSRWWSVIGGAAGGAVVGGSINLLGVDTLRALFGQNLTGITGAFEGALIGAGVSLGVVVVEQLRARARPWPRLVSAAIGAVGAGVLLTVIGGNLFSGSLELVARSFANSQMRMDPLANFFGEVHFGQTTQIVFGAIEGLLFGGCLVGGMELLAHRGDKNS
jgi:DNA-binding winged helix-turn-helix (wHTH) protein